MLGNKRDLLAKNDRKDTPVSSRKVMPFSKWLTRKDQIELVEKDMEEGFRYRVVVRMDVALVYARATLYLLMFVFCFSPCT